MLRLSLRVIAGALLFISVGAGSIAAQTGTITGTVSDNSGSPLANATVSVEGTGLRATTGGGGNYEIRSVPSGTHTLRVRLIGYESATQRVTVEAGGAARQDLTLTRSAVQLAPIDVVVGSRARHSTAEELAVPVDVYTAQDIQEQGTTETSQVLAALAPSVNFPHQTVTDATDIVRPFTLRGLSPDHTLVLVNGWRRHQTALLNTFPLGSPAGSSGVDLNAIPSSAIDRIEVLRDGASSQYGSDAIAGVVNIVMKEGGFVPFVNTSGGQYMTGKGYNNDGTTVDVNGGWGLKLGRGSSACSDSFSTAIPLTAPFLTAPSWIWTASRTSSIPSPARSSRSGTEFLNRSTIWATDWSGTCCRSPICGCPSTPPGPPSFTPSAVSATGSAPATATTGSRSITGTGRRFTPMDSCRNFVPM